MPRKRPARRENLRRNRNGAGSVYEEDGQWRAAITLEGGKRIRRRARSEEEAHAQLAEMQRLARQGALRTTDRQTVAQFLSEWLNGRKAEVKAGTLRPISWQHYRDRLAYVLPELGTLQLAALKPFHLKRFYDGMMERGFSPATVHAIHRTIRHALNDAVRWEVLTRSPAAAVAPPQPKPAEPAVLTASEILRLFDQTDGTRWHALWALLVTSGLRIGEALALRWSDYDARTGELQILESAQRIPGGGRSRGPLKTEKSRRTVVVTRHTRDALAAHRPLIVALQLKARSWHEENLIFPSLTGGLTDPNTVRKALERNLARASLPRCTLHALRHTYATRMLADREDISVVQEMLGHATEQTLLRIYSHVSRGMLHAAADHMDAILDAARTEELG